MVDKKTVAQILGENLKRIRLEKGVSRKELAAAIGVSEVSVSQYENGVISPTFERLFAIADFLKVSVVSLTGENDFSDNIPNIEKKIFEYRLDRAMKMAKAATYFPEILSTGKVVMTISNEIDHWENGTIAFSGGRNIEFKDKENFVDEMETTQIMALTFDLTFNEAMLLTQEQHRRKDQTKPKLTPNMQKIIRAVAEQEKAINKTPAE